MSFASDQSLTVMAGVTNTTSTYEAIVYSALFQTHRKRQQSDKR